MEARNQRRVAQSTLHGSELPVCKTRRRSSSSKLCSSTPAATFRLRIYAKATRRDYAMDQLVFLRFLKAQYGVSMPAGRTHR